MTSDDNNKEWSCGTCTFLNKPLYLACEMCGQDRPSQRPNPPRRQPSLPPAEDERDRAPRSVQRHHSVNITGTLIMTDDPADYETQDGKKPGEDEDEAEQDTGCDPVMDESLERQMLEPPAPPRGRSRYPPHETARTPGERRHTYQARERDHVAQHTNAPSRKSYSSAGSGHTLPTAYMGSSSHRLQLEESQSFADDVSSLSSVSRSSIQLNHRQQQLMNSSSGRRQLAGPRPRLPPPTPQEIHYYGQSNGLPVIGREPQRYPTHHRQSSQGRLMTDGSTNSVSNSVYSSDSRSRPTMGVSAGSVRNLIPEGGLYGSCRNLGMNSSGRNLGLRTASVNGGGDFMDSVLPSLAPPPVPVLDSPGDVDALAVFAKDAEAAERASSRRKMTPNEARKDRGKMLDNLSRSGSIPLSSNSSSSRHLGSSSRRLQSASARGFSTRVLDDDSSRHHPSLVQDTEALDSPNTRKERRKEKRKMKGAVRTLMATMKLSSITK